MPFSLKPAFISSSALARASASLGPGVIEPAQPASATATAVPVRAILTLRFSMV